MRPIAIRLTMLALSITLALQPIDARGINDRGRGNSRSEASQNSRPSNNKHHNRPGNNHNTRPGNNHNNRPNNRPSNNKPNHNRPDNNHSNRPGGIHNNRPGHSNRPPMVNNGHKPGSNHNWQHRPNHRPTPPPPTKLHGHHHPWHRPTPPPPHWRPAPTWRPFNTILGIAFGSAINFSVNALINSGYTVSSYGNNAVYVTDVPMLGMMWPDATLVYNSGGLCGSEFNYFTRGFDTSRYYRTYNLLTSNYGSPLNVIDNGSYKTSTWWGNNGQFITLSFGNGNGGFMTTLMYGN